MAGKEVGSGSCSLRSKVALSGVYVGRAARRAMYASLSPASFAPLVRMDKYRLEHARSTLGSRLV